MINAEIFAKELLGYNIVDCVVRNKQFFYFLAREDYTMWSDSEGDDDFNLSDRALEKRVITYNPSKPVGSQWGHAWLRGHDSCQANLSILPKEQCVVASTHGSIYAIGSGEAGGEKKLPRNNQSRRGAIKRLKTIDNQVYIVGGNRTMGFREGKDKWKWLTKGVPYTKKDDAQGFEDADGFAHDDLYAVGGAGDVWHFDGSKWRAINFPTNERLNTVCCGADGKVYISGHEGITFVGRNDQWKKIESPSLSLAFKDMLWHQDRVWCTNENGVWWIQDDKVVKADIPDSAAICAGNLSARDGVLMLAGLKGVAMLENGEWNTLFHYEDMVKQCKELGIYESNLKARAHEFRVHKKKSKAEKEYKIKDIEKWIEDYNDFVEKSNEELCASKVLFEDPASDEQLTELAKRDTIPMPQELIDFYKQYGGLEAEEGYDETYLFSFSFPYGLIDAILDSWGYNREEFDDYEEDAMMAFIDKNYQCIGWYRLGWGFEEAHYIYFDENGKFGVARYHQDEFDELWDQFVGMANGNRPTQSLAGIIKNALDEMKQELEDETEDMREMM